MPPHPPPPPAPVPTPIALLLISAAAGIDLSGNGDGPPTGAKAAAAAAAAATPLLGTAPPVGGREEKSEEEGKKPAASISPRVAESLLVLGVTLLLRLDAMSGVSPAVLLDAVRSSVLGREREVPDEEEAPAELGFERLWFVPGGSIVTMWGG